MQLFFSLCQILAVVFYFSGCASKTLERPKSIDESTNELPPELQKLRVETAMKELEPQPAPTPGKGKQKKSKKEKKATAVSGVAAPITIQSRRPPDGREQFPVGEKMTWNVGYLGFSAGQASVTVQTPKYINNRKVYHFEASAKSSAIMNLFYSLDDRVESFMDFDGLFTHRFHMVLDETKQKRDSIEIHDLDKMTVFWWSKLNHAERGFEEKKETQPIQPYSQDTLSALYYLRTVPLTDRSVIKLPMVVEAKTLDAEVTVERHEDCSTPIGKRWCAVLKPETKLQGVLQKTADNFIWITDDADKLIVKIEAHVKIGTVVVNLEKYERP